MPTTFSYNGTIYLYPSDLPGPQADPSKPEFRRQYAAGDLSVWVGHAPPASPADAAAAPAHGAGQGHAIRLSIYTDITQASGCSRRTPPARITT